jgi:glycosyltransferase involved in cell wall biosynthesis
MEVEKFDALVSDFLIPVINLPELHRWVLFQHNVETMIWQRQVENETHPLRRWYLNTQSQRLAAFERQICQSVKHVIAVSEADAGYFRKEFAAPSVSWIPTGVDLEYFTPPSARPEAPAADLIFVGSMDWSPNIDGLLYFQAEVLPLIRRQRPGCTLQIVGRRPERQILAMAEKDPLIRVTGTVPDVRPYLWNSKISIVPLRIGGGTRLKIYESMAARVPVVSTTIGAEGLECQSGENIFLADDPATFARHILALLETPAQRQQISSTAWKLVRDHFGWERIADQFEQMLQSPGRA